MSTSCPTWTLTGPRKDSNFRTDGPVMGPRFEGSILAKLRCDLQRRASRLNEDVAG